MRLSGVPFQITLRATRRFPQECRAHERGVVHDLASGLLQDGHAFLLIAGALLLFDELVDLRVAVADPFGNSGVEVLIVKSVGVGRRATGVVKGQLAAVDAVLAPIHSVFLADQFV